MEEKKKETTVNFFTGFAAFLGTFFGGFRDFFVGPAVEENREALVERTVEVADEDDPMNSSEEIEEEDITDSSAAVAANAADSASADDDDEVDSDDEIDDAADEVADEVADDIADASDIDGASVRAETPQEAHPVSGRSKKNKRKLDKSSADFSPESSTVREMSLPSEDEPPQRRHAASSRQHGSSGVTATPRQVRSSGRASSSRHVGSSRNRSASHQAGASGHQSSSSTSGADASVEPESLPSNEPKRKSARLSAKYKARQ